VGFLTRNTPDPRYAQSGIPAGIAAETFPRYAIDNVAGVAPSANKVYVSRITLVPGSYTTVSILPGATNASGAANCFIGLYNVTTLAKVAASADLTTAFNAMTAKTVLTGLTMNFTSTSVSDYYIAVCLGTPSSVTLQTGGLTVSDVGSALTPIVTDRHNATVANGALPDPLVLEGGVTGKEWYWFRYA
jgi:hypothetical protein